VAKTAASPSPKTVHNKFMTHMKQNYLILFILILIYSCNNESLENNGSQKGKPMVFNCLIDSIGKNDTLDINYSTRGCFDYTTEELRIYRKTGSLFAELTVSMQRYRHKFLPPLTQYLADSAILAYAEFEKNGSVLKTNGGCTTKDKYIVSIKTDSISFQDDGCQFESYRILKDKIFGRAEIGSYYEKFYH
jgi:hypothetical protein